MTTSDMPSNETSDGTDPDQNWEQLADIVENFCEAWEKTPPEPDFGQFAEQVKQIPSEDFYQLGLIELVKVDFEYRSKEKFDWRPLEEYLQLWPEIGPAEKPPTELIYEEYQYLSANDETLPVGHYKERFPENYDALLKMVKGDTVKTMSMFRSKNLNDFAPGQSINDFDLLSKLGRGAFAVVFLARQNSMQRLVALKISANQGLEGQTLAQLDHRHIVRVYDQQMIESQNLRLMYMQYIAGGSMADLIKRCHRESGEMSTDRFLDALDEMLDNAGQSPPVESINREWIRSANWSQLVSRIGTQLASALHYAHSNDVLHRDLKPANILMDEHGYPKLVDFNVSYGKQVIGGTAASFFGGSLAYMSLEQLEAMSPHCDRDAKELSGGCDVYSLGIVLYELLTGTRPFGESTDFQSQDLIGEYVGLRIQGMPIEAKEKLEKRDYLLGQAIGRSLEPDVGKRIGALSLQKHLEWAGSKSIQDYLQPKVGGWQDWVSRIPFLSVVLTSFMIAIFATWFIISYNLSEAIAKNDIDMYTWLRRVINIITFNGGMIVLYLMFHRANRLIRNPELESSESDVSEAIRVNLNYGHWAACLFVGLWSIAGMMYPIGLTLAGASLEPVAWLDFIGSHLLAGLTTGAYVFCGVTCFSLAAWHPRLVRMAMRKDVFDDLNETLSRVRQRVSIYQVLAIATPMASIAALVNWRQTESTFAVGVLSTAALGGLVFLSWTLRQVQKSLQIIEEMNR